MSPETQSTGVSDVRHKSTNALWVVDIKGTVPPIELSGAGLIPSLLLLMSSDGRRVASITTKYKIKVRQGDSHKITTLPLAVLPGSN